ncbi:MAG: alpha/beta fold hydrolase [Phycisphaerae bacterium]|nr:alpha/beta fold hydrolase [Phycisphaerae bacterium]
MKIVPLCDKTGRPAREDLIGSRPLRETLPLGDGYEAGLFIHRAPDPRGLPVVYLHGVQSHPAWFFASAAAVARSGRDVYQPTRRGSGAGPEPRGDAPSARQLLADVAAACAVARDRSQAPAVHLAGVSWGGKLAAAFVATCAQREPVASLTLVAPGIVPRVDASTATKLGVAACLLVCPRRRFAIPLNDPALFTDNEPMRAYLRADQYRLHRATARFLYVSRRLDRFLAHAADGAIRTPTTLILARRDRIIDNAATRTAMDRLTDGRAATVELDGAHTLEFEPDPTPLCDALVAALRHGENAGGV